jgi:predicted RNA-binding protein YlxR (DUF448 family)
MRKRPKGDLIRLCLDPESGLVVADIAGRMKGRGGYACRECLPGLRVNRRIQRAFRNRVVRLALTEDLLFDKRT